MILIQKTTPRRRGTAATAALLSLGGAQQLVVVTIPGWELEPGHFADLHPRGDAFGYAESASTALPYEAMDANDWCIDVSASPLYNRIVDAGQVGADAIAGSTEPMRRDLHVNGDELYRIGFVIEHNPAHEPGAGSCIFAHVWKAADAPTAGCTAMAETAVRGLLSWLQPEADPVFVLLPLKAYEGLQEPWGLPPSARIRTIALQ